MPYDIFTGVSSGQSIAGQAWDDGPLSWVTGKAWLLGNGDNTVSFVTGQTALLANFTTTSGVRGFAFRFRVDASRTNNTIFNIVMQGAEAPDQYVGGSGVLLNVGDYDFLSFRNRADNSEIASVYMNGAITANTDFWIAFYQTSDPSNKQYTAELRADNAGAMGAVLKTLTGSLPTALSASNTRNYIYGGLVAPALRFSRVESVPLTLTAAPTGTITSQPAPSGQSQRFVGTTTDATSGNYTITGSGGGVTVSGTFTVTANAFDFTVAGLAPGSYSPTLTLSGPGGAGAVSGASSFTIAGVDGNPEIPGGEAPPATAPAAPTIGTAVAGDGFVDVYFTRNSNGGSAVLDSTATLSTGQTATGASSPIRVTAPNGTPVTATVTDRNAVGPSLASAASNQVTPSALVQTPTVTSVVVSPSSSIITGGTIDFDAIVNGTNSPSQAVTWGADGGSIDGNGIFTPPARTFLIQTITITATSVLDPSKSGTATVLILALPIPTEGNTIMAQQVDTSQLMNQSQLGARAQRALSQIIEGLIDDVAALRAGVLQQAAKLDQDAGVTDTNYSATVAAAIGNVVVVK